jgi:hypothetical protein
MKIKHGKQKVIREQAARKKAELNAVAATVRKQKADARLASAHREAMRLRKAA